MGIFDRICLHMTEKEVLSLQKLLTNYSSDAYKIIKIWPGRFVQEGFHQWADKKPSKGTFLFEDKTGLTYWLQLIKWRETKEEWYLIVYPDNRSNPLIEIKDFDPTKDGGSLIWRYKPMKHDGRNEERKVLFTKSFPGNTAMIPFPTVHDEVDDMLDFLFLLVNFRVKTDDLERVRVFFPEGRRLERVHIARERNRAVVEEAKRRFKLENGSLYCEMCDFDFEETYGLRGRDFIEVHHKVPLHQLNNDGGQTHVMDLMMLCANCHRIVHQGPKWLTEREIRSFFSLKEVRGN